MDKEFTVLAGFAALVLLIVGLIVPGCVKQQQETFRTAIERGCSIVHEEVICPGLGSASEVGKK